MAPGRSGSLNVQFWQLCLAEKAYRAVVVRAVPHRGPLRRGADRGGMAAQSALRSLRRAARHPSGQVPDDHLRQQPVQLPTGLCLKSGDGQGRCRSRRGDGGRPGRGFAPLVLRTLPTGGRLAPLRGMTAPPAPPMATFRISPRAATLTGPIFLQDTAFADLSQSSGRCSGTDASQVLAERSINIEGTGRFSPSLVSCLLAVYPLRGNTVRTSHPWYRHRRRRRPFWLV